MCLVSVIIPTCEPVKDTAGQPIELSAIDRSDMDIRSPAVISMSSSR